tara:strand:- start:958 stop:1809 length:852 start_codon:yes stop_codon:yes gene_type:complete
MDNDNYMTNYKNMLNNDSILNNKEFKNKTNDKNIGFDGKRAAKQEVKFSQKLYLAIKNEYSNITQYDIDKIFFDNNLPIAEKNWTNIDKNLFIKSVKKKVGFIEKKVDIIEETKSINNFTPSYNNNDNNNYIILSINSNYRDKALNPNSNSYRYLFTKSGPKYTQDHYINKILIDVSKVQISHIILPKINDIESNPYIKLIVKELGSNALGENYFAKIMFNNKNDHFIEFNSNDNSIYEKKFMPNIILDQLNISFRLPNDELIDLPDIEHTITFKIWCKEQNI